MNELVDRLRAALDRAEEIARAAGARSMDWREDSAFLTDMVIPLPSQLRDRPGWMPMITREDILHMAANDPRAVLRSVAAHRKIIDAWCAADHVAGFPMDDCTHDSAATGAAEALKIAVEALAAVYFPEETDGA